MKAGGHILRHGNLYTCMSTMYTDHWDCRSRVTAQICVQKCMAMKALICTYIAGCKHSSFIALASVILQMYKCRYSMHYAHKCSFQSMHLAITVLYYVYMFSFLGPSPKSGLFRCLDMVNCASTVISHQARGTAIHLPGLCILCCLKIARKPLPLKPPLDCATYEQDY